MGKSTHRTLAFLTALIMLGGGLLSAQTVFAAVCSGEGKTCLKAGADCKGTETTDTCASGEFCCQAKQGDVLKIFNRSSYQDPLGEVSVPQLVARILSRTLPFVGALFLAMFLWGGTLYLTAGGDPAKVKKGSTTLLNATIGILIVLGAYAVVTNLLRLAGAGTS